MSTPFVFPASGDSPFKTSGAKLGENWGRDYYLFGRIIAGKAIIQGTKLWRMRHAQDEGQRMDATRREGAEHGVPTMMGKETAGTPWVKAEVTRLRRNARLEARRAREQHHIGVGMPTNYKSRLAAALW